MRELIHDFLRKTGHWGIPLLIALGSFVYGFTQKGWDNTFINGDGKGYYAYLPAIFIYHDLSFGFIEEYEKEHYQPGQLCDFRQHVKGGIVDRYYIGTAVAQLPFFLLTHLVCKISGMDADGYSGPYQYSVLFAASFYLFLGLWVLFSLLANFFSKKLNVFILLCITFATPLLFYTIYNPDFSHIYSFAFVTLFVKFAYQFFEKPDKILIPFLLLLLGIITLIRPINILILLVLPFLVSNWRNFSEKVSIVFKSYTWLLGGCLLFCMVIFIQLVIYYIQTGNFFVYSYGEANFDFLHPNFINFLFSYRKGMFIYTPLLFICLGGFIYLLKKDLYKFTTLLLFLIFLIYALSSWKVWTYGMTYGQRPVIEYYFLFALLLGYFLKITSHKLITGILIGLVALTIPHNLMQISQHRHYILHWDEMTKEKYWKVFLQTNPIYNGYSWTPVTPILDDTSGFVALTGDNEFNTSEKVIEPLQTFVPVSFQADSLSDSLHIILALKIFPESAKLKKNFLHVMVRRKDSFDTDGYDFNINMRNLEPGKWNEVHKLIKLVKKSEKEEFVVHIANNGKYNFNIKDVNILKKALP